MENKKRDSDLRIISFLLIVFSTGFGIKGLSKFNSGEIEFAYFGILACITFSFIALYILLRSYRVNKFHKAEIKEAYKYDNLTGLLSRLAFQEIIEIKLKEYRKERINKRLYYIKIGLDRFRFINETFGHKFADQILIEITDSLINVLVEEDEIGRLEGDCFGVFVQRNEEEVGALIKDISKIFNKIYEPKGFQGEAFLSAKVGIAAWGRGLDEKTEEVVKKSSFALETAKKQGNSFYKIYNKNLEHEKIQNLELEKDLREAVENSEIDVFFQPKVGLDGKVKSAEALARWYSTKRKRMVNPGEFIEMAEELGLIEPIGKQIMKKSAIELSKWHEMGYTNMKVAVNVSTKQFNRELPSFINAVIKECKIRAEMLEVEVTESALVNDKNTGTDLLLKIKDTGATIAIDDFGTGYSSLSYLLEFPLDVVKIDKSFIDRIEEEDVSIKKKGEAVVSTVIHLSHKLGCKVVAEGVESEEQLKFLKKEKCDLIQGYYYSKPLNKREFVEFLKNNYY